MRERKSVNGSGANIMLSDRIRKPHKNTHTAPVDGVMNAPRRAGVSSGPVRPRQSPGSDGVFQSTTGRGKGGFDRAEGFHAANRSQAQSRAVMQGDLPGDTPKPQQSILHMNLAGGLGAEGRRRKVKKSSIWASARRWALRSAAAVGVLAILMVGFLFAKLYLGANNVFEGGGSATALSCDADVDPMSLHEEGDGRVNIMMVGLDDEAGLTDTIMVASVDPVGKTITTLSIPRDLWVNNPAGGDTKINAVYPIAKRAALSENPDDERQASRKALSELEKIVAGVLGIDINYYAAVDVAGFERAVEIVGGVTMDVPEELAVTERLWDDVREEPYLLDVAAGEQEFDPQRALFFVRTRKTSPRGDFDRTERQRLFAAALGREVMTLGNITNPVRLAQLMDTFSDNAITSLNVDDARCLVEIVRGVDDDDISSVGLADPPDAVVRTGMLGSQSVVLPTAGAGNYEKVHELVRSRLVDGFIARENAGILVLNGGGRAGYATEMADMFKTYGYNVIDARDAPAGQYNGATLVDIGGDNPYTKRYLELRLETSATRDLPDGIFSGEEERDKIDFVIILD